MIEKQCLHCNKNFEAKKDSRLYCSTSCRVMRSRKNKGSIKAPKFIEQANNQILASLMEKVDRLLGKEINYAPVTPNSFDGRHSQKFEHDELGSGTGKTFQQFMNEIPDLQYEAEFKKFVNEVDKATNMSQKQKDLLLINMRKPNI